MKFEWKNYRPKEHALLEIWFEKGFSSNSWLISKYATTSFTDDYESVRGGCNFMKVVSHNGEPVAVVGVRDLIEYESKGRKIRYGMINPIVVNPKLLGKGYGTAVVKDLVENLKEITGISFRRLEAMVEKTNERSLRLFRGQGFSEDEQPGTNFVNFKKEFVRKKFKYKSRLSTVRKEKKLANEKGW